MGVRAPYSAQAIANMAVAAKRRWQDPSYRAQFVGHETSAQTRSKIAESVGRSWQGADGRKLALAERNRTPEQREAARQGRWKGGRIVLSHGYIGIYQPDHPRAYSYGYVYEHILVAEQTLGRPLLQGEEVHHRNGVKSDNCPENLQVFASHAEHQRHHASHLSPETRHRMSEGQLRRIQTPEGQAHMRRMTEAAHGIR